MKIISKNIIFSIMKVGVVTSLLAALMLMSVDLFKNLETYTEYAFAAKDVLLLTLLYFPDAFLTSLGPSFLFSVTYYLSMLHANNEIIAVFNAGVKYGKIILPCILTSVFVSLGYFVLNETVALNCLNKKDAIYKEITNMDIDSHDNYQISLYDSRNGYLVYADEYIDRRKTLYNVSLIRRGKNEMSRVNAYNAQWSDDDGKWIFNDCICYTTGYDKETITVNHVDHYVSEDLELEPELFRNLSNDVSKMDIWLADKYVKSIRNLNPVLYARTATDLFKRILTCLTPLVMTVIACCINYRFKKNILFFSIFCSLCIAVVYYVIQMVTLMLANQGVIRPYMGTLFPFIIILLLSQLEALFIKD